MNLFSELQRRRVYQAAGVYAVSAWVLIQVTDVVGPRIGLPDWVLTFIIFLAALLFPFVLVISWLFERTPEGLRRTANPTALTARGRIIPVLVLVLVSALVAVGAYVRLGHRATDADNVNSVAVLPFANMSASPEDEYFADGITEEILNLLSRVPGLRVPARTSSFSFKGKDLPVQQIAAPLRVATLLEGSIQKSGTRVRINAQLIDARTDQVIWSDRYDRDVQDVFAVQAEIARAIVDALRLHIDESRLAAERTSNPAAHESYLRGLYILNRRHADEMRRGLTDLSDAVSADPNYAQAWAALAMMYAVLPEYTDADVVESARAGTAAAERALTLDKTSSDAEAALGEIAQGLRWDWPAAREHLDRALQLDPKNATAHQWRGELDMALGNYSEALDEFDRALDLDPLSSVKKNVRAGALRRLGRLSEAIDVYREITISDPGYRNGRANLAIFLLRAGRTQEALAAAAPVPVLHDALVAALGERPRLSPLLADPTVRARRTMVWTVVNLFLFMNQPDSAAAALLAGAKRWDVSIANFARDPDMVKALKGKPDFEAFVKLVNL